MVRGRRTLQAPHPAARSGGRARLDRPARARPIGLWPREAALVAGGSTRSGANDRPEGTAPQYAFLEASPNAIVTVDTRGAITYANPQVAATFGYDRDEVLGGAVELLLPERVNARHAAQRNAFLAHPEARPGGIGLDLTGRRKDGTEFPVEISLSPVETAHGLQVFATVVDITERKRAEEAIREASMP